MSVPPKEKAAPITGNGLVQTATKLVEQYLADTRIQELCLAQWDKEADRLAAEYRRTEDRRHLEAYRQHVDATGRQMPAWRLAQEAASAKCRRLRLVSHGFGPMRQVLVAARIQGGGTQ